ncbi:MAG: hypothetical protein IH614_02775 [Desulfuromonadales bacterium]|nr:hypothetical protein [Desulfuromonadales bacterium]
MRKRLVAAKLWDWNDPDDPLTSMSAAWQVLSRLEAACRYLGVGPDGEHEFLLLHPRSGALLARGRGHTSPEALCQAALALRTRRHLTVIAGGGNRPPHPADNGPDHGVRLLTLLPRNAAGPT